MRKISAILIFILCAALEGTLARADNLVANPGFETGDLTSWTISGVDSSPGDNGIYYGVDKSDAYSGSYGAYFGPVGGVLDLTQTLATTPGTTYTVSFWLAQVPATPAGYTNSFLLSFGGNTLFSQTDLAGSNYTGYSYTGVASSASTVLQFAFRDDTGFFSLDDVSVSGTTAATPEPSSLWLTLTFAAALGGYLLLVDRKIS